jgi:para-nitrobenzyl esterase
MEVEIDTPQGRLEGRRLAIGVEAYKGIPYAATPIGPLRFRPPEAAPSWTGVRPAVSAAPSPVQSGSSAYSGTIPGNRVEDVSEDCLTVDVWTPAAGDGGRRPVLVWICGGAYLTGGSAVETYDGAALAAGHDVVVVSVNYRMGALGFLWLEGGVANCGLRDQLAALRWTREHIDAFGGDPANITVFGESAGAGSILHLLPAAAREGLLRRAILQSPGVEHTQTPSDADKVKQAVMSAAGVASDREMHGLPWKRILAAQEQALSGLMATVGSMPFHPVVDGDLVTAKPGVSWDVRGVDVLITWTAEEMRLYPDPRADDPGALLRRIRALIARRTGADPGDAAARRLAAFYSDRGTGADIWAAVQTDSLMILPARRVALALAEEEGVHVHVASFDWGAAGGEWRRGAFHAIDLPFSFGTLDRCGWLEFLGAADDDRGAHRLAERHMVAWAAYARGGDPGWAAFPGEVMHFDRESFTTADALGPTAAAWDGLWSADGPPV